MIYDSGLVSLEHLLLSWYPSLPPGAATDGARGSVSQFTHLIKTGPEFRSVKQLVLVQIVKLGDFKTPISRPFVLKFVPERATLQI